MVPFLQNAIGVEAVLDVVVFVDFACEQLFEKRSGLRAAQSEERGQGKVGMANAFVKNKRQCQTMPAASLKAADQADDEICFGRQ